MSSAEDGHALEGLAVLPADLRGIGCDLLLYKALLGGPWFEMLLALDPREDASTLRRIVRETETEAQLAILALRQWDPKSADNEALAVALRNCVFEDLLVIKESTVEAFLRVGMRAPTESLRREFLRLADMDRRHAEELRAALGTRQAADARSDARRDGNGVGAHAGRDGDGTLSRSIRRVLDEMRLDGQDASSVVLSAVALRHLRDEGTIGPDETTLFGLDVEIDFGWQGECFAVRSRDHAALAELVLARRAASQGGP